MAQASFFYQAKADPSRFLAPPVDLAWMRTRATVVPPVPVVRSTQGNPALFLATSELDLSWMQTRATPPPPVPVVRSTQADISGFLALPVDIGWIPQAPGPVYRQVVALVGGRSDPSVFFALGGGLVVTDDGQASLPWTDTGMVAMLVTDDGVVRL